MQQDRKLYKLKKFLLLQLQFYFLSFLFSFRYIRLYDNWCEHLIIGYKVILS